MRSGLWRGLLWRFCWQGLAEGACCARGGLRMGRRWRGVLQEDPRRRRGRTGSATARRIFCGWAIRRTRRRFGAGSRRLRSTRLSAQRRDVPAEIIDCASLLRYAYREALKRHDENWFVTSGMEVAAPPGEMRAWSYPHTPLGTALFRVRPGAFEAADVSDGAFAQFADAKTLVERNAYFVSRDVRAGAAGRFAVLSAVRAVVAVALDDCYAGGR